MEKELLKYCKYYDGKDNPPKDAPYEPNQRFWYLEKEYYEGNYNTRREYWESGDGMKMCLDGSPDIEEFFKNGNFSKTVKGFLAYCVINVLTHCPMGSYHFIFGYGDK